MSWEKAAVEDCHKVFLRLAEKEGGYLLETNLYEYLPKTENRLISTETLGEAFEPEQKFENPDGSAIVFQEDYFGESCGMYPLPGPFADPEMLKNQPV